MKRLTALLALYLLMGAAAGDKAGAVEVDRIVAEIGREVSGLRARDYTARLWRYDKWYDLPAMQKAAAESRAIMLECRFDRAELVDTPADGVARFGTWTNPVGWDVRQATLEVIEPADIPDEYRRLCDYLDNPTSLIGWSAPTPPEGVTAELVVIEEPDREALERSDVRGKLILVPSNASGLKRYMDEFGVAGLVSDQIEGQSRDLIDANCWINAWSDRPGGWMMNADDSRNNFGFAISQKKGRYLRDMVRRGRRVVVRAKVDSRYYTDSTLPYVDGCIRGTGDQEVVVVSHMFEWGANDDCAGCAAVLEGMRAIKTLIESGALPRPKRTIRSWMGQELYGSMAFAVNNLDRLRQKTVAVLCCDSPASNYDLATTAMSLSMSFNACPSFTDAVLLKIARTYYAVRAPRRLWREVPFITGLDNFFCEPLIGVPTNAVYMDQGNLLHHNSFDTIETVDPRSLAELAALVASYLYYLADAGVDDVPAIAALVADRGMRVIIGKAAEEYGRLLAGEDGAAIGRELHHAERAIDYCAGLQVQALQSLNRLLAEPERQRAAKLISIHERDLRAFGAMQIDRFRRLAESRAAEKSVRIARYRATPAAPELTAIVPRRNQIGTLTLAGIPTGEWQEVRRAPSWWRANDWAAASYWWCDGVRNLAQIQELMELEAGTKMTDFDLVNYYKFLEKFDLVEFVR